MAVSKTEIRSWLQRGKDEGATHVLVACDTFDWEDYPVYVKPGETAREHAGRLGSAETIMEVYDLSLDLEAQLAEVRAFHW
jgi:hypothetical protein